MIKFENVKSVPDSYKMYVKNTENPVSESMYLLITGEYHKFLIYKVLDGEEVTLPSMSGSLSVKGIKQKIKFDENGKIKGLAPDWPRTKKYWAENPEAKAAKKLIFHTNPDTDGIRYHYHWSRNKALIINKSLYSLIMTRTNKRVVSERIKSGQEYISN